MCLNTIHRKLKKLSRATEKWGWKIFDISEGKYHFQYYPLDDESGTVPCGKWLKAEKKFVILSNFSYLSGFHIYLEEPKELCLGEETVRIRYRKARIWGNQDGKAVVVADEMFVPRPTRERV